MSIHPLDTDFASRALAALNAGQTVTTSQGTAERVRTNADRPYRVSPTVGITTWHASPALAVARLRTL